MCMSIISICVCIYIWKGWKNFLLNGHLTHYSWKCLIPNSLPSYPTRRKTLICHLQLTWFGLSVDNDYEDLKSGIRVVQALATLIPWCTNVTLQSCHLLTFHSKRSYDDGVCRLDYLEAHNYISTHGWQESYPNIIVASSRDGLILLDSLVCD